MPSISISNLKEQYETSERKGSMRNLKIDKIVVKDHNYCVTHSEAHAKKIKIKWFKSNPPKRINNVKCILVNIPT